MGNGQTAPPKQNNMAATTTSISNKEIATMIPSLNQFGKGNDASFANMFADETEAASMGGLLINDPILGNNFSPYAFFSTNNDNNTGNSSTPQQQQQQNVAYQAQQQQAQPYKAIAMPTAPLHSHGNITQMQTSVPQQNQQQQQQPEICPQSQLPPVNPSFLMDEMSNTYTAQQQHLVPPVVTSNTDISNVAAPEQVMHVKYSSVEQQQGQDHNTNSSIRQSHMHSQAVLTTTTSSSNIVNTIAGGSGGTSRSRGGGGKRKSSSSSMPISEDDEENEKKRRKRERNLREQERSHRITDQIGELRRVLADIADVKFRKTDKYTILVKAGDCIRQLQSRTLLLDEEHKKLVNTISETSELVHSNTIGNTLKDSSDSAEESTDKSNDARNNETYIPEVSDSFFNLPAMALFDYKTIFTQCSAPLSVADLDGRFLDCNADFETATGCTNDEMTKLSIFHLLKQPEDVTSVCKSMASMIGEDDGMKGGNGHYWTGTVCSPNDPTKNFSLNVTLARDQNGNPRFFNCALFSAT